MSDPAPEENLPANNFSFQGWTRIFRDELKRYNITHLKIIYVLLFIIYASHILCFCYLYAYVSNMEARYETSIARMESRLNTHRFKRDINRTEALSSKMIYDIDTNTQPTKDSISLHTGLKTNSSSESLWIWLNEYSRVPLTAVEEFCRVTHDQCPNPQKGEPGISGPQGNRGEKGDKGDKGSTGRNGFGTKGLDGPRGPPGERGEKGDKGEQGYAGLDGRDGIPGEPGLDGVPGRHGKDGTPGKDGIPANDGIPGNPGLNGIDGYPGEKGEPGPQGPPGPPGLPGPKGKSGKNGEKGLPGHPGVIAYNHSVNGSDVLFIPPSLIGAEGLNSVQNITARENENIKLHCAATGNPEPKIMWTIYGEYDENHLITRGPWKERNVEGPTLHIKNISRIHMGSYTCTADNGYFPPANQTFHLSVNFPPFIKIESAVQNITLKPNMAINVSLECIIEAYPRGVYYWVHDVSIIEESHGRYSVDYNHVGIYKTILQMNISDFTKDDLGMYYCFSKNNMGTTHGYINVTDDPRSAPPIGPDACSEYRVTFGKPPPPAEGSLCPECEPCKICGFGYRDVIITSFENSTNTPLIGRKGACEMTTIGKPVYHSEMGETYGSWMKDAYKNIDFVWISQNNCTNCLLEYANKTVFTNKTASKTYMLNYPFTGNDHVMYDEVFYYYAIRETPLLVSFHLKNSLSENITLPFCDKDSRLYKSLEYNRVDVMADENGVWVICAVPSSNNTAVLKVNTTKLGIENTWNISVRHQDAGEMFIVCGILYAVDSINDITTKISLALDLYDKKILNDIDVPFTNPFQNTTMISYNPRLKELYTWDKNVMLTYPIKLHDLGREKANDTVNENEENNGKTGHQKLS